MGLTQGLNPCITYGGLSCICALVHVHVYITVSVQINVYSVRDHSNRPKLAVRYD